MWELLADASGFGYVRHDGTMSRLNISLALFVGVAAIVKLSVIICL